MATTFILDFDPVKKEIVVQDPGTLSWTNKDSFRKIWRAIMNLHKAEAGDTQATEECYKKLRKYSVSWSAEDWYYYCFASSVFHFADKKIAECFYKMLKLRFSVLHSKMKKDEFPTAFLKFCDEEGVGSKLLSIILQNFKADDTSLNKSKSYKALYSLSMNIATTKSSSSSWKFISSAQKGQIN